jgi:BRCT domain type II-containing protein
MTSKKKSLKKKSLIRNKNRRTHKKRKCLIKRNKQSKQRRQRKHSKKMFGGSNIIDTLSDSEIDEILDNFGDNMEPAKRSEAKELMKKLKFDPNYTEDCFFSKLPKHPDDDLTLREQAESKVQCWYKYGDELK